MAKTKQAAKRTAKKSVKSAKPAPGPAKKSARPANAAAKAKTATPAKPAKPKRTARSSETPIDIAARMGRRSGESFALDGHAQAPDETVLQEWAYDGFLNAGGFDAVKGSDDNDPVQLAAIKQMFFDAFKVAVRMRLDLPQPNALG